MHARPSHAAVETLENRRLFSIVVALGTKNELFTVDSNDPDTVLAKATVKRGLQRRELIQGIDYRPANNQLYGLGSTGRLYRIDPVTGNATAVGGPAEYSQSAVCARDNRARPAGPCVAASASASMAAAAAR